MCNCGNKQAAPGTQFVVKFNDGTESTVKYPDETSARVALARTGRGGQIRAVK